MEVGYHIHKKYWSNGYATEAAKSCVEYGFSQLGQDKLISIIDPKMDHQFVWLKKWFYEGKGDVYF